MAFINLTTLQSGLYTKLIYVIAICAHVLFVLAAEKNPMEKCKR